MPNKKTRLSKLLHNHKTSCVECYIDMHCFLKLITTFVFVYIKLLCLTNNFCFLFSVFTTAVTWWMPKVEGMEPWYPHCSTTGDPHVSFSLFCEVVVVPSMTINTSVDFLWNHCLQIGLQLAAVVTSGWPDTQRFIAIGYCIGVHKGQRTKL